MQAAGTGREKSGKKRKVEKKKVKKKLKKKRENVVHALGTFREHIWGTLRERWGNVQCECENGSQSGPLRGTCPSK
jgi:hypothetical protein